MSSPSWAREADNHYRKLMEQMESQRAYLNSPQKRKWEQMMWEEGYQKVANPANVGTPGNLRKFDDNMDYGTGRLDLVADEYWAKPKERRPQFAPQM